MARGRPAFVPTPEQRNAVRHRSGLGMPQEAIARYLNISLSTLQRYFRDELTRGIDDANIAVSQSIWNMATGRQVQEWTDEKGVMQSRIVRTDPNPTMAIWWSKTRMGWKEPSKDTDASPVTVAGNATIIVRGGLPDMPMPVAADDEATPAQTNGSTNGKGNGTDHTH